MKQKLTIVLEQLDWLHYCTKKKNQQKTKNQFALWFTLLSSISSFNFHPRTGIGIGIKIPLELLLLPWYWKKGVEKSRNCHSQVWSEGENLLQVQEKQKCSGGKRQNSLNARELSWSQRSASLIPVGFLGPEITCYEFAGVGKTKCHKWASGS